ncbi:TRAP transporter large permease subunit [Saccharopolyspora sp. NPDC002686]|uniref:TRAP transporter large permease subunit n=1 Tax=Saccharopolyspora sp. NPDC002686 TaxID=3154541 RepID=UPI0033303051
MTGVWALAAFVGVIITWNAAFKRNIGEAMILGFLAVCAFALVGGVSDGGSPLSAIGSAVLDAMQEEVTFAGLAFVFMSYLLTRTPVLDKLIDLLNSMLGRLRGGPVYTATVAGGIFGAIAHVGAAGHRGCRFGHGAVDEALRCQTGTGRHGRGRRRGHGRDVPVLFDDVHPGRRARRAGHHAT